MFCTLNTIFPDCLEITFISGSIYMHHLEISSVANYRTNADELIL
jgi:hypothetical protein